MNKHNQDNRFHIYIRGIILIGFTMLMIKLIITGSILNFIAPRMMPFIYFAVVVFLLLGIVQIWRSGSKNEAELFCLCGFDHSEKKSPIQSMIIYSFFIFPIVTGFVFHDVVLDSSIVAKRGFKTGLNNTQGEEVVAETDLAEAYLNDPEEYMKNLEKRVQENAGGAPNSSPDVPLEHPEGFEIQAPPEDVYESLEKEMLRMDKIVLEDENYIAMTTILDKSPEKFEGKEIEFVGFVYREPDFNEDQFVVARFGLSCCVADASVYGTLATFPNAKKYDEDQWVKVKGNLTKTEYNDWEIPYVQILSIEQIEQPKSPYVYETY
ncbi:TIGR03943 family putative permease subunit [Metabacillus litoralis]|uniref:TIGR03943 family putative permease subunit n=1 Tax=Metabacillus litoralis TaxID=152268 RepID=UPI00203C8BCC|nr:TIGR03943 family protein [Metabacillus litoralis]MCM3652466.1 TIGR03943 family protein [Metabacillus litoralis]